MSSDTAQLVFQSSRPRVAVLGAADTPRVAGYAARVKTVELSPGFAGARFVLGGELLLAGDSAEAFWVLRDAVHLDPRPAPAWHTLFAIAQYLEGETDRAVELQESIRTTHPELILVRTALVIHYATSGSIEEVRTLVSEILAVRPDYTIERLVEGYQRLFDELGPDERDRIRDALRLAGLPERAAPGIRSTLPGLPRRSNRVSLSECTLPSETRASCTCCASPPPGPPAWSSGSRTRSACRPIRR